MHRCGIVCYFGLIALWRSLSIAATSTRSGFRWLTTRRQKPELVGSGLTILMIRRAWGPFLRWQKVLLVACGSLIVADDFRHLVR